LILMGDWCAAAQPIFENQVCDDSSAGEYGLDGKKCGDERRNSFVPIDGGG